MRLLPVLCATLLASTALAFAQPSTPTKNASPTTPEMRQAIAAAEALAAGGDPSTAAIAFEAVASHADFARLPGPRRGALLLRGAWLATEGDQLPKALALARASVEAHDTDADAWYLLAQLAGSQDAFEEAGDALARLATSWPDEFRTVPALLVNQTLVQLGFGPASTGLVEALHATGWAPEGVPADHVAARLALLRLEQGDEAGARAALTGITAPDIIVWLRSDRRFDAVVDRTDPRMDPARAAAVWVGRLEALSAAQPSSLPLAREHAHALLVAGRPAETLALARSALAEPSRFDDTSELPWMANLQAIALRRLGRTEEAVAALTEAADMDEYGQRNVSQTLNLGHLLLDMQRPEDALSTVAGLDGMSGYGLLVQSQARMRAHLQLGQEADADVWFERIRAGSSEGQSKLLDALLWNGRVDEAAAQLSAMLADPAERIEALEWCQGHLRSDPLPGRLPWLEARRALLARADVLDAIQAVGRIEDTGIYHSPGID